MSHATTLPPLSVLVVEDEADTAGSTAELLTTYGHEVRVTGCGRDALRATAAETPDVILLDIGLPGMDGWELTARLRRGLDGKQPFVVAVTGYATDDARLRSADAGVDVHLAKPVEPRALERLLAWVRYCLAARPAESTTGGEA
jgi:CheY-like chemotaxis protein